MDKIILIAILLVIIAVAVAFVWFLGGSSAVNGSGTGHAFTYCSGGSCPSNGTGGTGGVRIKP